MTDSLIRIENILKRTNLSKEDLDGLDMLLGQREIGSFAKFWKESANKNTSDEPECMERGMLIEF